MVTRQALIWSFGSMALRSTDDIVEMLSSSSREKTKDETVETLIL